MKFDNIRINGSTHVLRILNVLNAEKYTGTENSKSTPCRKVQGLLN